MAAAVVLAALASGMPAASATAYSSPATGTHHVVGSILQRYLALGGPAGKLGYPTTDELATPVPGGRYNLFQGGAIYWTSATGAHQVGGAIRGAWGALGWETGRLGFPTTSETATPTRPGAYNHFQGGSIIWSPATGAHPVWGDIRNVWAAQGTENGPLGFPTTGEVRTPNGQGAYNLFQGGAVYWSPATGAHSILGAIRGRWGSLGYENSALGFPTSSEYVVPGGRAQNFQYGRITWTPAGGAVVTGAPVAGGGALPLGVNPPGTQALTVVAPSAGSTTATFTAWEKRGSSWVAVLGPIQARVGSAGIGTAREGSARTPAGTWRMSEAFGRQANPGTVLPYRRVDGDDWWVSDTRSPLYNQYAQCAVGRCPFDERVSENLHRIGAVYDLAVVMDYNRAPVVPGAGSAFFLHVANASATGGCVSIDRASLASVMRWLKPSAAPVIAVGIG
ncbi:L,D-transpeptidase family protein [Blastococcus sp. LR1]|uniref:L,D-transpeptidase family protein n=1 Tax=Blastococcus sp. LR1 TaxID=2877000 RepID=UPI001CC98CA2|nr:L,D-transpeptidase family protein [Blastococcus sp. LR1]MCA0146874.1 L,D-transpeptidase family protein [Blastococcus sp. LR1]